MEIRSLDNAIIEVAGDGKTAKGFFYVFGLVTDISERGPISNWILGTVCMDFVYENGQWRILHMQYLEDIDRPAGSDWGKKELPVFPDLPEFEALRGLEPPKPNVPCVLHESYSGTRAKTQMPRLPEPYQTFAETFSYGA